MLSAAPTPGQLASLEAWAAAAEADGVGVGDAIAEGLFPGLESPVAYVSSLNVTHCLPAGFVSLGLTVSSLVALVKETGNWTALQASNKTCVQTGSGSYLILGYVLDSFVLARGTTNVSGPGQAPASPSAAAAAAAPLDRKSVV